MDKFVVIDTETTWSDKVMSIGAVVADAFDMRPVETKYYILDPEYRSGGMYSAALGHKRAGKPIVCSREEAMADLVNTCSCHNITRFLIKDICPSSTALNGTTLCALRHTFSTTR